MGIAGQLRGLAGRQVVRHMRMQQRHAAVVQGDVQRLPQAAAMPLVECQQNPRQGIQASHHVDDRQANAQRTAVGFAVDAHQPGHRLDRRVVTRQATQGAIATEAGDRTVDQPGKTLAQDFAVIDAPALQGTGLEVLDQHIGAFQQAHQQLDAFRPGQVHGDPLFVTVDAAKIRSVRALEGRAPTARLIAAQGFELDHFGAMVRQCLGTVRPAQHPAEVDHFQALEGPFGRIHKYTLLNWVRAVQAGNNCMASACRSGLSLARRDSSPASIAGSGFSGSRGKSLCCSSRWAKARRRASSG
ncbi:hypothetical protein D3C86_1389900 [compost metagenome]